MDERKRKQAEKLLKIMGEIDLPEEYLSEVPQEEIIYDWDGGVIDEVK